MENRETEVSAPSQLHELQAQYDWLSQVVSWLLFVLIVVSATLTIFLARHWRFTKTQIELIAPQANQILTDYNQKLPMMQDFVKKLNEYAKTHSDFAPISTKYHLAELLGKPGSAAVTNSLPAAGPPKK